MITNKKQPKLYICESCKKPFSFWKGIPESRPQYCPNCGSVKIKLQENKEMEVITK